ncbi:hypothetical protein C0992_004759 [Termitomyces sp. T32_za158]|nr:hypothetical protein C0992_004759 [Termitomyces sp. T32_za158]
MTCEREPIDCAEQEKLARPHRLPPPPEKLGTRPAPRTHTMLRITDDVDVEIPDDDQLVRFEKNLMQVKVDVKGKMGNIEDRMGKVEDKMGNIEDKVGCLEDKIGHVEDMMGKVEGKVGRVEDKMGNVVGKMGVVEGKMDNVEGKMGSVEDRMDRLEKKMEYRFESLERIMNELLSKLPAATP